MLITPRDPDTSLPLSDVIRGHQTLSWAAQLLLLLLCIYYWVESGILVAIDISPWKQNWILRSHFDEAHKLRLQSYSSTPESPPCAGFYSRVQTAMSSRIINSTSQVPSSNKNARMKKVKKCKSNNEANSIILKSFIRHVNANTNTTGYDFLA